MRAALALAVVLTMPDPASARCYSVWRYPWPQHCGVTYAARTPAREDPRLPPMPPADRPLNFVAPTIEEPPEGWTEDALRAFAIQKLREQMSK